MQSGIVEISNEGVVLHNVRVVLDDQGMLVIGASGVRAGRVAVHQPGSVQARASSTCRCTASSSTYRSAEVVRGRRSGASTWI